METSDHEYVATLRAAVGLLGEKGQAGWWPSAFFAPGSNAFLSPVFPRTELIAQCSGVTGAAAKVHDERIGVGQVYHLFRLPEDLEQAIHRIMHESDVAKRIKQHLGTGDAALQFLRGSGGTGSEKAIGPTRVAGITSLREPLVWHDVAATYADGFESRTEIYPYFTDRK